VPVPRSKTASPVSYFTSQEPILEDPENQFLTSELTRRQSDIFSYDPKHTAQEDEDERKRFRDFVDVYGDVKEIYRTQGGRNRQI
jgi:hypothetical protein